jgi:hypothetical protein
MGDKIAGNYIFVVLCAEVQDRLKWKDIVEKAKTPPEL